MALTTPQFVISAAAKLLLYEPIPVLTVFKSLLNTFLLEQVCQSSGTDIYPHMPIRHPQAARYHKRHISSVSSKSAHLHSNVYIPVGVACMLADLSNFGLLGSKVHKMKDSLPWMPMNRRVKFGANSFILGREICNRTKKQTKTYTQKQ